MKAQVHRDGQPVSPLLADRDAAFVWLLKHQGQSVDYATRYGGYAIVDIDDA